MTQKDLNVDPRNKKLSPLLRDLAFQVSTLAFDKEAEWVFEPWLKHQHAIRVNGILGLDPDWEMGGVTYRVKLRQLVKNVCGLTPSPNGAMQEGRGELSVGGHTFALTASSVPTPWGERVILKARREGEALTDPATVFPWVTDPCPWLKRTDFLADEALREALSEPAQTPSLHRRWVRALKHLAGHMGARSSDRDVQSLSDGTRRLDLLSLAAFNEPNEIQRDIIFDALRTATRYDPIARLRIDSITTDTHSEMALPRLATADGDPIVSWQSPVPSGTYSMDAVEKAIADLARLYPSQTIRKPGAQAIAFALSGHPIDVMLEETATEAGRSVFLTPLDESPESEWRQRSRQGPPSPSVGPASEWWPMPDSFCLYGGEPAEPCALPRRTWMGWLRGKAGVHQPSKSFPLTLEDLAEWSRRLSDAHNPETLLRRLEPVFGDARPPSPAWKAKMLLSVVAGRYADARAAIEAAPLDKADHTQWLPYLCAFCCTKLGDPAAAERSIARLGMADAAVAKAAEVFNPFQFLFDHLEHAADVLASWGLSELAAFVFEQTLIDLACGIHRSMATHNESKYFPGIECAHRRRLSWHYAQIAADHETSRAGIASYVMPTEHGFMCEETSGEHGGLYWQDITQPDGTTLRRYFPNYLKGFAGNFSPRETVVTHLGSMLSRLEKVDEAQPFLEETKFFC